ncbi:MAG: hypothetical protein ACO208_08515, partial [Candidatus Puniceispirillaceae bacterium]
RHKKEADRSREMRRRSSLSRCFTALRYRVLADEASLGEFVWFASPIRKRGSVRLYAFPALFPFGLFLNGLSLVDL